MVLYIDIVAELNLIIVILAIESILTTDCSTDKAAGIYIYIYIVYMG